MAATLSKCGECGRRAVARAVLPTYATRMHLEGIAYDVEVNDLPVYQCGNCGAVLLDDEATDLIDEAFRTEADLLAPAEITRQRESLGVDRAEFGRRFGVSASVLAAWEAGTRVQRPDQDKHLRGLFSVQGFREFAGVPALIYSFAGASHAAPAYHFAGASHAAPAYNPSPPRHPMTLAV